MRDLLVDALACHRLTRLVTEDVIFNKWRAKIYEKWPPTEDKWSYVLTCPWCASVWLAGGIVAARSLFPKAWTPAAKLLALSSLTGLVMERESSNGSI